MDIGNYGAAAEPRWEIWASVYTAGRPTLRAHLAECGEFDDEALAYEVGALVSRWLRTGTLEARLLREVPDPDDRFALVGLPELIEGLGYDPRRALVTVRRVAAGHDSDAPGELATAR